MDKQKEQLESLIGKSVQTDVPLDKYTTFKIGGSAKYFLIANDNEDLVRGVTFARKLKIPVYVLGGGSNVLISDNGFNGLIWRTVRSSSLAASLPFISLLITFLIMSYFFTSFRDIVRFLSIVICMFSSLIN